MVGSWLWQGLIGRFSTVFDRGDMWLMFTCGWCGPWAEEEVEVAQERVDVSLVQIMAQYRSFALLITRVTLLLTPLQTSPHKRCLCCRSLTIQIRSEAHTHQQLWRKLCTNAHLHMNIHQLAYTSMYIAILSHTFLYKHECLNTHTVSVCTKMYTCTTKLFLDKYIKSLKSQSKPQQKL